MKSGTNCFSSYAKHASKNHRHNIIMEAKVYVYAKKKIQKDIVTLHRTKSQDTFSFVISVPQRWNVCFGIGNQMSMSLLIFFKGLLCLYAYPQFNAILKKVLSLFIVKNTKRVKYYQLIKMKLCQTSLEHSCLAVLLI